VVLVFGASRLPELGEGVGRAIKNLKKGMASDDRIQVKKDAAGAQPRPPGVAPGAHVEDAEILEKKS